MGVLSDNGDGKSGAVLVVIEEEELVEEKDNVGVIISQGALILTQNCWCKTIDSFYIDQ